jgi:hypothetical protein
MSSTPTPAPPTPPRGVSFSTLILSALLALALTAAAFLAFLHFTTAGQTVAQALSLNPAPEPSTQRGTVSPRGQATGVVYYPFPFASPPHLDLACDKRDYIVTQQDEAGFTWAARDRAEDFLALAADAAKDPAAAAQPEPKKKPDLEYEDFTWEAKGLRAPAGRTPIRPAELRGTFIVRGGASGEVYFPTPYASPPNVVLSGLSHDDIVVEECTARKFRWRSHADPDDRLGRGEITWTARGARATVEELGREDLDAAEVFEQNGDFASPYGGSGEIFFPLPFQSPPNVEVTFTTSSGETVTAGVVVSGCTAAGFQWKDMTSSYSASTHRVHWKAKGVRAAQPAEKKEPPPSPKPG